MFLFARELTGSAPRHLVAGAAYAFAPHRLSNLSHLRCCRAA
jgi:hypothetical protein